MSYPLIPGLQTLEKETYKVPETRVASISGARERIRELKEGDEERARRRARVQALIDGHKPYDEEEMYSAGRGDDANINFREAEGMVAAATTPYYELAFGVPRAINATFECPDLDISEQKKYEWSNSFSDRYTKVLWGWKGYKVQLQMHHYQMVVHGRGPIMWDGKKGFWFKAKRDDSVWVADNAHCDLNRLEELAIPGHYGPIELFRLIERAERSGNKDWRIERAKKAVMAAAPPTLKDLFHDSWNQYTASLRRGDVWWANKASRIYYTDYLVREFDGKITHSIVLDNFSNEKDNEDDDFLYQKIGRFDSFSQIIDPFFFDVGPDGLWYSVKGLGPKIFDFCDVSNRFQCTLINGAMASCGIFLQAQNGQAMQKIMQTPIVRAGGANFVPPDWQAMQLQLGAKLDGPIQVRAILENTVQANTGQYRQRAEDTPQPTLGQEQLNVAQQATLTRGAYDRYYHYFDDLHEELKNRMLAKDLSEDDPGGKEALEMRRLLVEVDGIPEEYLEPEYWNVKAVRSIGYGSPQMQEVVNQKIMGLLPTMDEEGRRNALRLVTASMVTQANVDAFYKKFEDMGVPNNQEAWATFENNVLRNTPNAQLAVTPAQNPTIHFTIHYKDAITHLQEVKTGKGDPMGLALHLQNAGPHLHVHLQALAGDPTRKDQYKQMQKMWLLLAKESDKLQKQIAATQKGQKPNPQVDPELAGKMMKMMGELEIKRQHMLLNHQLKKEDYAFKRDLKDLQAADNIQRKNLELVA